jgi:hypothetical protein
MNGFDHQIKCLKDLGIAVDNLNHLEVGRLYKKMQDEGFFSQYYSCTRKDKYATPELATKAAYNLDQIRPRQFEPYWCQWCDKYHIGGKKDRSMFKPYVRPEIKGTILERKLKNISSR